jgi:hypothetical protein
MARDDSGPVTEDLGAGLRRRAAISGFGLGPLPIANLIASQRRGTQVSVLGPIVQMRGQLPYHACLRIKRDRKNVLGASQPPGLRR